MTTASLAGSSQPGAITVTSATACATARFTRSGTLAVTLSRQHPRPGPPWRAAWEPAVHLGVKLAGARALTALLFSAPAGSAAGRLAQAVVLAVALVAALGVVAQTWRARGCHGAEHQAILAAEAGRLDPAAPSRAALRPADRVTPTCGTSLALCVLLALSGLAAGAVAAPPAWTPWAAVAQWGLAGLGGGYLFAWQGDSSRRAARHVLDRWAP